MYGGFFSKLLESSVDGENHLGVVLHKDDHYNRAAETWFIFIIQSSLGCLTKTFFEEKTRLNPLCKYLGVALKESKRIFDFYKSWGVHKSFPFWPFLHCRFSLSPHSVWQNKGWVKIYNIKKVKTEMTCAPPKSCQNQKSFWIPSK